MHLLLVVVGVAVVFVGHATDEGDELPRHHFLAAAELNRVGADDDTFEVEGPDTSFSYRQIEFTHIIGDLGKRQELLLLVDIKVLLTLMYLLNLGHVFAYYLVHRTMVHMCITEVKPVTSLRLREDIFHQKFLKLLVRPTLVFELDEGQSY